MAYSTILMLRLALAPGRWIEGQTPDPDNPTNTAADLTDAQLQDAISEADSFIDAKIGGRYTTPVAPLLLGGLPPHPLDYWSRNVAAYNATLTYRESQDFTNDDPVYRRALMTFSALDMIQSGKGTLPLPEQTGNNAQAGVGQVQNPYTGDLFGAEDFEIAVVGDSWPRTRPTWQPGHWWPGWPS